MATTGLADKFVYYALNHPRMISRVMILATLLVIALAAVPNFVNVPGLHAITVDTDPENMLSHDEPVRVFHDRNKAIFGLSDIVVVGIVNEKHEQGVFNKDSLQKVYELTEFAKTLQWQDEDKPSKQIGVIEVDMIAPSMVDNIEQGGPGVVNFNWLMPEPPASDAEALAVRDRAAKIPFLDGTLISENGKALAIYLPITSKDISYQVAQSLEGFIKPWQGDEQVYITGLPVAEDTFGVEMFIQMAISAPLAMLVIFLLLWWFFKRLVLVVSPMIVAMVSSLITMGLLIITGNTIHIMSSMIPIFVMPIAVLDAVHILSEFFDRYPLIKDKRETVKQVMHTLFTPMLFTTLTTMAAFASLALTPIPPVQVFGIFVAIGVFLAWLLTILFIPAYLMLVDDSKLQGYGHQIGEDEEDGSLMGRVLSAAGRVTTTQPKLVIVVTILLSAVSAWGISKIVINDNPINWFGEDHRIRVADRVLNEHFGGTYMAYLSLQSSNTDEAVDTKSLENKMRAASESDSDDASKLAYLKIAERLNAGESDLIALADLLEAQMANAEGDDYFAYETMALWLDEINQSAELFKQPEVLAWMEKLQAHLLAHDKVGKINSLADIVKTVHRELLLGQAEAFRIPATANAVGQTLITYQNSHRPHDLWHFVTPDYQHANLWLQLTSGDNRDMEGVIESLNAFVAQNPAPAGIKAEWFGLTYINVVWQDKMVNGMVTSFMGSFLVVLVMMMLLFRSVIYGVLSMIPLTVTVGLIYGVIGIIGKDYDMPVAILSALSLGLAVDYAIHFLARSREAVQAHGSWPAAIKSVFGEPARAISRNAIVLGAGFMPLLAAPLVPYQTVGVFIAAIIVSAGVATLVILPALVTLFQNRMFGKAEK